jgi:hypothetical protein
MADANELKTFLKLCHLSVDNRFELEALGRPARTLEGGSTKKEIHHIKDKTPRGRGIRGSSKGKILFLFAVLPLFSVHKMELIANINKGKKAILPSSVR